MKNTVAIDRLLVIGIGNEGRRDDGLGWKFLELLNKHNFPGDIEFRYQLQIEDAELISRYDDILFVDATKSKYVNGYNIAPVTGKAATSYTSHAIPPSHIVNLCGLLYKKTPNTYLLAITGADWNLQVGLSKTAKSNIKKAWLHMHPRLIPV